MRPSNCLSTDRGIGSFVNLASGYVQSLFTGSANATSQAGTTTSGTQNTSQLSPFAQVLSTLQQLQQSSPSQYTQLTQQISGNLQTAAQSATAAGDTGLAGVDTRLATDFQSASTSGQLPNVQDLARAMGGGHRHHHFGDFSSGATTPAAAGTTGATSGVAAFLQTLNSTQAGSASGSLNPMSIIENTLSTAGV